MVSQKKGNPNQSFNLAADIEEGFDELGKLPSRLERYFKARSRALINVSQIEKEIQFEQNKLPCLEPEEFKEFIPSPVSSSSDPFHNLLSNNFVGPIHPSTFEDFQKDFIKSKEIPVKESRKKPTFLEHLEKLHPRIFECGQYLGFKDYYTVGKVRLFSASFCKAHLLCPLCAIRRGSVKLNAYLEKYHLIMRDNKDLRMSMVTLTVKNGDDLEERYIHLKKSVQRLLKHRRKALNEGKSKTEFKKVLGLIGSYEVTNKEKGWHPHIHMMVLHRERFDYLALQDEWLKITGDSHVLNVTPCKHPKEPQKDFLEVFKYALKFSELTPEQNMQAYKVFRGKHLLISAGLFRAVDIPDTQYDQELDDLPFHELFYQYIHNVGYGYTTKQDLFHE